MVTARVSPTRPAGPVRTIERPRAPFDPNTLNGKGSLFLTRPSLGHHTLTREELLWRAGDVLGWVASGKLKPRLSVGRGCRRAPALEGRQTAGNVLLIP